MTKFGIFAHVDASPITVIDIVAACSYDINARISRPDIAGVLELKEETIESLLAAACLLQLSQVIQVCCNFLMKQLHPSNCLGIRSFADAQGCVDLLNVAHNYTMVGGLIDTAMRDELFIYLIRDCTLELDSWLREYTRAAVVMRAVRVSRVFKHLVLLCAVTSALITHFIMTSVL